MFGDHDPRESDEDDVDQVEWSPEYEEEDELLKAAKELGLELEARRSEVWLERYHASYDRAGERASRAAAKIAAGPFGVTLLDRLGIEGLFDLFDPAEDEW